MDLLPTIARILAVDLPEHRPIDGKDIWPLMSGKTDAKSPHEAFYCYYDGQLRAVRDGRWKLHFPHKYRTLSGRPGGTGGRPVQYDHANMGLELFDLKNDIGETTNVADKHPEIVVRLQQHAERARERLGDRLTGRTGSDVRPQGRVD